MLADAQAPGTYAYGILDQQVNANTVFPWSPLRDSHLATRYWFSREIAVQSSWFSEGEVRKTGPDQNQVAEESSHVVPRETLYWLMFVGRETVGECSKGLIRMIKSVSARGFIWSGNKLRNLTEVY